MKNPNLNLHILNKFFLEDSVLWYVIDFEKEYYLSLNIHQRINFKQSYF